MRLTDRSRWQGLPGALGAILTAIALLSVVLSPVLTLADPGAGLGASGSESARRALAGHAPVASLDAVDEDDDTHLVLEAPPSPGKDLGKRKLPPSRRRGSVLERDQAVIGLATCVVETPRRAVRLIAAPSRAPPRA